MAKICARGSFEIASWSKPGTRIVLRSDGQLLLNNSNGHYRTFMSRWWSGGTRAWVRMAPKARQWQLSRIEHVTVDVLGLERQVDRYRTANERRRREAFVKYGSAGTEDQS